MGKTGENKHAQNFVFFVHEKKYIFFYSKKQRFSIFPKFCGQTAEKKAQNFVPKKKYKTELFLPKKTTFSPPKFCGKTTKKY